MVPAATATANVVPEATDLRQVGQRDQNAVTGTKHAALAEAVRKHHQNPLAPVEAPKMADAALARIADDRERIAVLYIVVPKLPSVALVADAPILMLTHEAVDQVIDHRVLAHRVEITDHSLVHTGVDSVTVDPSSDIMPVDTVVINLDSIHDTVRFIIVDSAYKAAITDPSSVHTAVTSDIMPVDTAVINLGSIQDTVRSIIVDSAHKAAITDLSLVHTAVNSAMADLTLDITPVATAIISAPILAPDRVARFLDTSAHAV